MQADCFRCIGRPEVALAMTTDELFDVHRLLRRLGLLAGRYDGQRVVPTRSGRWLQRIWALNVVHVLCRFIVYALLPTRRLLQFLMANCMPSAGQVSARLVSSAGGLLAVWTFIMIVEFDRTSRRPAYAYWLRFLSAKQPPPQMPGISLEQRRQFQRHSSDRLSRLQRWFLRVYNVTTLPLYAQYARSEVQLSAWLFWPIWAVNSVSLHVYAGYIFFCTFGLPACMPLLSQMLASRFDGINGRLRLLLSQREAGAVGQPAVHLDLADVALRRAWQLRLSFAVHAFQLTAQDLLRINLFWSRIFFLSYHFGLMVIVFCVFGSYDTQNPTNSASHFTSAFFFYMLSICLPTLHIGRLVQRVWQSRAYNLE